MGKRVKLTHRYGPSSLSLITLYVDSELVLGVTRRGAR